MSDPKNERRKAKKEKIKKSIVSPKINPNHIPGIYNYCDRWCERCAFTSRCLSFEMDREWEVDGSDHNHDADNENFWEGLSLMYEALGEAIKEKMKHDFGVDIDELPQPEPRPDNAKNHPLSLMAKDYSKSVSEWMKTSPGVFKDIPLLYVAKEARPGTWRDYADIITWYHIQISAKLYRALTWFDDPDEDFTFDRDGSAKVALIGIDRTIAAFSFFAENSEQDQDQCLGFLKKLAAMRALTEKIFPGARAFLRPGFDD